MPLSELRQERAGSPRGLRRLLLRAPIFVYRARLGFLLGHRFSMLEHTGRRTGRRRRTVLEIVAEHDDAVYVAAGWGSSAQWLQNIRSDPEVTVHLGVRRFRTTAVELRPGEAADVLSEYAADHPRTLNRLAAFMLGDPGDSTSEQIDRLARAVPLVRLPT